METFKIKVKEIHIGTFDVEAESREDALKKFEEEYWKNPNDYLLVREYTFFGCAETGRRPVAGSCPTRPDDGRA